MIITGNTELEDVIREFYYVQMSRDRVTVINNLIKYCKDCNCSVFLDFKNGAFYCRLVTNLGEM